MSYLYNEQVLGTSCIISENRKDKPYISTAGTTSCPFCEGNEAMLEHIWLEKSLENGDKIRVINNKYPVVSEGLKGIHDVIVDTLSHDKCIEDLYLKHWVSLLEVLHTRWNQVAACEAIQCIQVFKNYGKHAGASISHLHWQLIALEDTPMTLHNHYEAVAKKKGCILCDHLKRNQLGIEITDNEHWESIAPYGACFSHETWIILKEHRSHFGDLNDEMVKSLGEMMYIMAQAYKALLPDAHYNICIMSGRPNKDEQYHLYLKILPRIGRIAGFELATGCYINTVEPREHAERMKGIIS